MKYALELTGHRYSYVNLEGFPEVVAAVQLPNELGRSLSLLVWGVVIRRQELHPSLCQALLASVRLHLPAPIHVSGWSILQFGGIYGGTATLSPCKPVLSGDLEFVSDSTAPSRDWPITEPTERNQYSLSVILEQPLGHLSMNIYATGPVQLFLNTEDCISDEEFLQFSENYTYDFARCRQLEMLSRKFEIKD